MPATSVLISHHRMRVEQERGRVRPLCPEIPEFCRWYGAWWIVSADGWLRVTDGHIASRLDRIAIRLDCAEDELGAADGAAAGSSRAPEAWPEC